MASVILLEHATESRRAIPHCGQMTVIRTESNIPLMGINNDNDHKHWLFVCFENSFNCGFYYSKSWSVFCLCVHTSSLASIIELNQFVVLAAQCRRFSFFILRRTLALRELAKSRSYWSNLISRILQRCFLRSNSENLTSRTNQNRIWDCTSKKHFKSQYVFRCFI